MLADRAVREIAELIRDLDAAGDRASRDALLDALYVARRAGFVPARPLLPRQLWPTRRTRVRKEAA